MKENNQHICIAELRNIEEAQILRGLLESENIKVFVSDIGTHDGGFPVPLHVPFVQKEEAQKIVDLFYENMKPTCPKCESKKLKTDYMGFFKDFFKTNTSKEYKYCDDCAYYW